MQERCQFSYSMWCVTAHQTSLVAFMCNCSLNTRFNSTLLQSSHYRSVIKDCLWLALKMTSLREKPTYAQTYLSMVPSFASFRKFPRSLSSTNPLMLSHTNTSTILKLAINWTNSSLTPCSDNKLRPIPQFTHTSNSGTVLQLTPGTNTDASS